MRGLLKGSWVAGVVPLSHTWLLPGKALESAFMPAYLLLVFFAGSAAWWVMERGRLTHVLAFLLAGWGLSALQGAFGVSAGPVEAGLPESFAWSGIVVLAWLALGGGMLVLGRRAAV